MKLEYLKDGDIVPMVTLGGACALDGGDEVMGLVQRGHHAPWDLRRFAEDEVYVDAGEAPWPKRTYMREMPWSILYPDDPPCDRGEESIIWEPCNRSTAGAVPVTYLPLDRGQ